METRVWMVSLLSFSFRSALNRKENKLLLLPLKCRRLPNGFLLYNQWTKLGCGVLAVLLVRVCVWVFPRIISINGRGNGVRWVAIKKHFILQPASQPAMEWWRSRTRESSKKSEQQRQHIIYALWQRRFHFTLLPVRLSSFMLSVDTCIVKALTCSRNHFPLE